MRLVVVSELAAMGGTPTTDHGRLLDVNASSIRDLLQQVIDERKAAGLDASFRALQALVEAEESSSPRGLSLNRTTASQIIRGSYKGEPSPGTIRAIGWLAKVSDEVAFTAAGRRPPGPPFADDLPPGVDDLTDNERRAAIEILRALVAQRREINRYVDASSGAQESGTPTAEVEDQKTRAADGRDGGTDPEGQAADDARPNVWREEPDENKADDLIGADQASGIDASTTQSDVDLAGGWRRGGGESETRRIRREQDEAAERGDA
ncbi:hypothetical protein ACPXB3_21830 [Gordonia sp. DT219]|uniref:hypothetical protein n=1 Tax=Gordonia sp. DT219 TaxID=3416658 RepID=UPI003CF1E98A